MAVKAIPFSTGSVNGLKHRLSGESASPRTAGRCGGAYDSSWHALAERGPSLWVVIVTPGLRMFFGF